MVISADIIFGTEKPNCEGSTMFGLHGNADLDKFFS